MIRAVDLLLLQKRKVKRSIWQFADDWIRTNDLWFWKRPLYQLSHNHCPCTQTTFWKVFYSRSDKKTWQLFPTILVTLSWLFDTGFLGERESDTQKEITTSVYLKCWTEWTGKSWEKVPPYWKICFPKFSPKMF